MTRNRSKEAWERRIDVEPDGPIGAGAPPCPHMTFNARVAVHRLTAEDDPERVTAYLAEVQIHCDDCGRKMQFLGLPAGIVTNGAAVSPDGLEARLGLVPQGEALSMIDQIGALFRPSNQETH